MTNTRTMTTTRVLLFAALSLSAGLSFAEPVPTAATGGVSFDNPAAGVTNITAPDNAIIDYASFNVGVGESVNFIQPGADARVLNRIHDSMPSQINGTITANGIVYLVNPSGVIFGPNAVVDAAAIFAAAGSISDSDFLSGLSKFDNLTGPVHNHGTIHAQTLAALLGHEVINTGTISVPNGTAILASGSSVYIGSPLGGVMVQLQVTPRTDNDGGVAQEGTVIAQELSLVSGDMFALAITGLDNSQLDGNGFNRDEADTDGDGDIDFDDFANAYASFTGPLPAGTGNNTQQQGDVDGDGDTDDADLGHLFALYTGPIISPPPPPPVDPPITDDFALSNIDDITRLPEVVTVVNLTEADLSILQDQLGISPRPVAASERIDKVQARGLYNDLSPTFDRAANPDGSYTVANARLDADVVRQALQVYYDKLASEGVSPADRTAQIRTAVDDSLKNYASVANDPDGFDADRFVKFLNENNPALLSQLGALEELRELTLRMGLSEREKLNSDSVIINRAKPQGLTYEQMKATLESAGSLSQSQQTATTAG